MFLKRKTAFGRYLLGHVPGYVAHLGEEAYRTLFIGVISLKVKAVKLQAELGFTTDVHF